MINNIKIGADPELFLKRDNIIISAEGLIGGSKNKPKSISDKGHAIQEDNVMVEYNIPPSSNLEDFINNHNYVLNHLEEIAELNNCKLCITPSAELSKKDLSTNQARKFACEPDFDVYKQDVVSVNHIKGNWRFAGGHIHVGWDNPSFEDQEKLVKAMDVTLGLNSINLDKDIERKKYYGTAGRFRFKNYGIEYRVLSNFWLQNENLMKFAYEQTIKACDLVNSGIIDNINTQQFEKIYNAINNNSIELKIEIEKELNLEKKYS